MEVNVVKGKKKGQKGYDQKDGAVGLVSWETLPHGGECRPGGTCRESGTWL
jgi:hypothetical protein